MEYAIQLLLPILGGLLLGGWLVKTFHVSPMWTVALAILGMILGIGVLYKRFADPSLYKKITPRPQTPNAPDGKPYEEWRDIKKKVADNPDKDDWDFDGDDWDKDE